MEIVSHSFPIASEKKYLFYDWMVEFLTKREFVYFGCETAIVLAITNATDATCLYGIDGDYSQMIRMEGACTPCTLR